MNDNDEQNTALSFFSGFNSWQHLFRFVSGVAAIVIICGLVLTGVNELVIGKDTVKLSWDKDESENIQIGEIDLLTSGIQINSSDSKFSYSQVVVPGNEVWFRTGVSVRDGATLRFKSSGSVVLAAHLLVQDYLEPNIRSNAVAWYRSSPDGRILPNGKLAFRTSDDLRRNMTPFPEGEIGQLIGVIVPKSISDNEAFQPNLINFQQKDAFLVGSSSTFTYSAKNSEDGVLYLTVNDLVADFNNADNEASWLLDKNPENVRKSYFPNEPLDDMRVTEKIDALKQQWDLAKNHDARDVFYQDNLGSYNVAIFASQN